MKKAIVVIMLLSIVVMFAGAQQAKYDCKVLEFDLTQTTAIDISQKINFYLSYGYVVVSTAVWGDTYIVVLQARVM